jgi:hypothetical protein
MRQPPKLGTSLLTRFGLVDDALVGDVLQEWSAGRSSPWFWYQTVAAIVWAAVRDLRRWPMRMCMALLTGWAIVATIFLNGDTIADGLAGRVWGWDRQQAYVNHSWGPFYVGALLVAYGGFGASAWLIARLNRSRPTIVIAYVAATFSVLLTTGIVMEILIRRGNPIPMVHPLFFAVFTTLPFFWHSGVVLVPLAMLVCGVLALRPSTNRLLPQDR